MLDVDYLPELHMYLSSYHTSPFSGIRRIAVSVTVITTAFLFCFVLKIIANRRDSTHILL
jgi:hypothetical protein